MSQRPRIRTLKPEMWHDEKVGRLSRDSRLLFVVLITLCDDEGRFIASPHVILGHGYPYEPDAFRKFEGWMRELTTVGLVATYGIEGVEYGLLPGWSRHQKVNKSKPSILPVEVRNGTGSSPEHARSES